jgi:hypothetical protein
MWLFFSTTTPGRKKPENVNPCGKTGYIMWPVCLALWHGRCHCWRLPVELIALTAVEQPMSEQPRVLKTSCEELPQEIVELAAAVQQLPPAYRHGVEAALNRVIDSTRRRRRILTLVQEALGQLRLDMKYLAFDLEATRRERDQYRRQVEGNQ